MATVRDLVKGSMRLIGVLAAGETPSGDELADGVLALNDMVENWSTENLIIYSRTREELSWASGQQSRTWGSTGNFSTSRPLELESAAVIESGTTEQPLNILSPKEWQAISQKSLQSTLPTDVFIDGTFPNATVYLWPVPSGTITFVPYTLKPLSSFADADTAISLPPGYSRALKYNLAIDLAPEYGRQVPAEVLKIAAESKASIKRRNVKENLLAVDEALTGPGVYDINLGSYR